MTISGLFGKPINCPTGNSRLPSGATSQTRSQYQRSSEFCTKRIDSTRPTS